jgi:hypothetical protein
VVPSDASTCPVDGGCDAGDAAHDAAAPSVVEAGSEPDANVDPNDECPHQPDQYVAGSCGCGFAPDEACNELAQKLTHRYSFDGEGHVAVDSVGDADGEIVDTELDGLGNLELAGIGSVELPGHVPLESTSATYEVWLTWHGGDDWQRIFDFGRLADDGSPEAYIYLSPRSGSASGKQALLFAYTTSGSGNTVHLHGDDELPIDTPSHVAVVLSARANRAALYLNGVRLGSGDFTPALADIGDTIDRLGRSLFPDDPGLDATLHEFRIYGETLGETVVAKSYELGPDAAFADIP